ncbi:hypothetical protein [Streptomyces sp. NPDC059787]|uniref:hypothetical protein n=1 Tax=Streptomyces sp. NPDC059787 TaxID=3346947 RepID=UPI00365B971E
MAEELDAGASGHQALLQVDIGDPALVDAGVVRGDDSPRDGVPVFMQDTGERGRSAVREVVQPTWQRCGVTVVQHGREAAGQVVGAPELWAVVEEPGQAVVDVQVGVGRDPAGGLVW